MAPILSWMRGAPGAARPHALARMLFILCLTAAASAQARPSLTISGTPAASVTAGQNYAFTPTITDSRSRPVAFAIANKPSWALFSSATGTLSGTPTSANAGTYANIVIAVSDGILTATLPAFSVQVSAPTVSSSTTTAPPVISGTPPTTDVAGSNYAFQPTASDPAGLTLSFSVQNKPAWAAFSIATGLLSGTPTSTQAGVYANVVISASDGQQSSALPAFSITVTNPTTSSGGSALLGLTPPSTNTDGSALTDLAGYKIYYGTSPSNLTQLAQLSGSTATSYTASNLASGTWYFGSTAYTTTGVESAMSSIVSKSIP